MTSEHNYQVKNNDHEKEQQSISSVNSDDTIDTLNSPIGMATLFRTIFW